MGLILEAAQWPPQSGVMQMRPDGLDASNKKPQCSSKHCGAACHVRPEASPDCYQKQSSD
jgi:hypothetical protein